MDLAILIFSGYNQRAVIAFIRTLEKNNIHYGIIARDELDTIFLTSYSNKVISIRTKKELELNTILQEILVAKKSLNTKKVLIAPSTESLNRFVLSHRQEFSEINCEIPLVEQSLYEIISDKKIFSTLCQQEHLLVPSEINPNNITHFPVVIKPKKYISATGKYNQSPVIATTQKQLDDFLIKHEKNEYFIQEFVDGKSFYLLFYINKANTIYHLSQENYIQQSEGKSIIAAEISELHKEEICKQYENLLKKINFKGFIMIELRQHKNQFYMIEANPRFWGPSQLFVDAGYNFFEIFLKDYCLLQTVYLNEHYNHTKYFWKAGWEDELKNHKKPVEFHKIIFKEWIAFDIYNREDTNQILS